MYVYVYVYVHGNPLQCSCLENPRDGGAWWAAVYGVAQSRTWLKWLSSICGLWFNSVGTFSAGKIVSSSWDGAHVWCCMEFPQEFHDFWFGQWDEDGHSGKEKMGPPEGWGAPNSGLHPTHPPPHPRLRSWWLETFQVWPLSLLLLTTSSHRDFRSCSYHHHCAPPVFSPRQGSLSKTPIWLHCPL